MRLTVPHEMAPSSAPIAQTMLLPVNSSDPAKMTNVSAIPKATPMTNF